jgi:Pectate lyase superfamily protein
MQGIGAFAWKGRSEPGTAPARVVWRRSVYSEMRAKRACEIISSWGTTKERPMNVLLKQNLLLAFLLLGCSSAVSAASVITTRLEDRQAVYLTTAEFGAHGDGKEDDSTAIQAAIDKAEHHAHEGIVLVPSGRYRLTRTVYVWPGVRVFGYGATRPVFLLADQTPGYQNGLGVMVMFTGARPGPSSDATRRVPFPPPGSVPPNNSIADANSGIFYSAMSNIDFEIGEGNPAAIGIRFHVAQHAFLSHMDFHVGSGPDRQ